MPDTRQGLLFGTDAYALWGLFPLYWPLLEPAGAVEILAHRIVWSSLTMTVLVLVLRRTPTVLAAVLLGLIVGLQRRASGGILAPILTHCTWSLAMLFALPAIFGV